MPKKFFNTAKKTAHGAEKTCLSAISIRQTPIIFNILKLPNMCSRLRTDLGGHVLSKGKKYDVNLKKKTPTLNAEEIPKNIVVVVKYYILDELESNVKEVMSYKKLGNQLRSNSNCCR
uniref:Uncharacterized protein n=1 Tax=Romanomermis culicivorax TaxID=13658 RepID=A0A915KKU8_ROMCU